MGKYVYFFGAGSAEGNASMKDLLGGKGAGLAEMTNAGLPVPPGFTISTVACNQYYENKQSMPPDLWDEVNAALKRLEETTGKGFGSVDNPLLVSVRSGAKFSMPGMMDTVLNLGLNRDTLKGLAGLTGNERFAYDAYRRFIQMFGRIVLGVEGTEFDHALESFKANVKAHLDTDLTADHLKEICAQFEAIVEKKTGAPFPSDPMGQLEMSVKAVFGSWFGKRAIDYRRINKIPDDLGTAVNIVTMVFGNMGQDSGTGVAFTRNPATGEPELYGEYLQNAQGEDVVAGVRTPKKIAQLKEEMPEIFQQFKKVAESLEKTYKDVQDLEFTIERGKLWMLQTRSAKRTGLAAVRIAVDMVSEGLIDKKTAIMRVEPLQLDQLLHPVIDPAAKTSATKEGNQLAKGLPASPGAATGQVVFDADEAEKLGHAGKAVILVRVETSPEDFHGMVAAQAILTARGGMTSHAAVVARGMGKCCVAGCEELRIDYGKKQFQARDKTIKEGDFITLDGSSGEVFSGQLPIVDSDVVQVTKGRMKAEDSALYGYFAQLLSWGDEVRKLKVRTNADTPHDSAVARGFGAEGIGLCRTEHMFFEGDRIDSVREMIAFAGDFKNLETQLNMAQAEAAKSSSAALADRIKTLQEEIKVPRDRYFDALSKLLPMQREDFVGIFRAMDGLPVTIRTLDPPLHEFLPHSKEEITTLASKLGVDALSLIQKVESLREANPMLGHRGCRLGIVYPEITEMQARAIFEAAAEVTAKGIKVIPEIMIPLVSTVKELSLQAEVVNRVAKEVMEKNAVTIDYLVGTMIEVPRAALTAGEIATEAQFFSFGTNDLTQTAFGFSRDDSGKFLPYYVEHKILKDDPFQVLDQTGVGRLVQMAVTEGRATRNDLKIGICGEHGGEPQSVGFCHRVGLNYVSCSPYRVPIARLAAAQAALETGASYTTA